MIGPARLSRITVGLIVVACPASTAASAATIRQGNPGALPSSLSSAVATGTVIGSTSVVASSTFSMPAPGNAYYGGTCTSGSLSGTLSSNGTGAGNPVSITTPAFAFGNPSAFASCGSDNDPNYDLVSLDLVSHGGVTVTPSGPGTSTVVVQSPQFRERLVSTAGVMVTCQPVSLVPPATSLTGTLYNGTTTNGPGVPRATFYGFEVYASGSGASSTCVNEVGDNSSTYERSSFSVTFGPLKTLSGPTAGRFIGSYDP